MENFAKFLKPVVLGAVFSKSAHDFYYHNKDDYSSELKEPRNGVFFSKHRDSDEEWETWTFMHRDVYLLALALHIFFSQFISRWLPSSNKDDVITPYRVRMAYCLSFMLLFFSITENLLVWIQLGLGYIITVSMVILLPELEIFDFLKILKVTDGLNYVYTIFSMFLVARSGLSSLVESMLICTSLRTSSYCFEYVSHKRKEYQVHASRASEEMSADVQFTADGNYKLVIGNLKASLSSSFEKLCFYNFYLPTLILGPVVPYLDMAPVSRVKNDFYDKFPDRLKQISRKLCKLVGYTVLVDVLLHHIPLFTLANSNQAFDRVSGEMGALVVYLMLLFDWFKAYLLYETTGAVLKLDGFQPLKCPVPLTSLYLFADTFFDRKMHYWICRYVYDPVAQGDHDPIYEDMPKEEDSEDYKRKLMGGTGVELKSTKLVEAREATYKRNMVKASVFNESKAAGEAFLVCAVVGGLSFDVIAFCVLNWLGLSFEYYARRHLKGSCQGCSYGVDKLQVLTAVNLVGILLFNFVGFVGFQHTFRFAVKIFSSISGTIAIFTLCFSHVQRISK